MINAYFFQKDVFGLSYADEEDADFFHSKVVETSARRSAPPPPMPIKSATPKPAVQPQQHHQPAPVREVASKPAKTEKKQGFFGRMKGKLGKMMGGDADNDGDGDDYGNIEISRPNPKDFKHVAHLGLDVCRTTLSVVVLICVRARTSVEIGRIFSRQLDSNPRICRIPNLHH